MKKLSVIIVNYNTKEILRDCLKNLQGKYTNMEIIVVDNDSPDGSAKMVKNEFLQRDNETIKLVESPNNGLAAGSNLGLQSATGDYLLFLGSDAFPQDDTLTGMINYLEDNSEIGVATPKLITRDGQPDMDAHRGFPTPWASLTHFSGLNKLFPHSKLFNQYFLGWKDMNKPHEIDLCISHFMLIKRQVFEDVGTFDTNFFLYGEDVDFCWRVKQAGWHIYYLPQWQAVHYKGASIGVRETTKDITKATPESKIRMLKNSTKAMKIFYHKHFHQKYPKFISFLIFLAIDVITFIRVIRFKISK
jgi:hypothetical protein